MPLIYLFFSLLLYVFSPEKYSIQFCSLVTILFFLQTIPFIMKKSNGNYVNFYSIFFIGYFFVNFFYAIALFPIDREYFSVFRLAFNENYINKGTALAQLASSSFITGTYFIPQFTNASAGIYNHKETSTFYLSHKTTTIITMILFLFFLLTVGQQFLAGDFTAHSPLSLYILQLLQSCFILSSIIFFKYFKYQKQKSLFYAIAGGYILIFLSVGDRGPGLSLILILSALYAFYIKKIPLKFLLIFGVAGMLVMSFIGIGRTTDYTTIEGNVIQRGIEKSEAQSIKDLMYSATGPFVVNTRNLYVGLEYVDKNGLNWGETMYGAFIAVVPFGQYIFSNLTGITPKGSSSFFTELAFGKNPPYGLGTNLISDVYISFGTFGVIILFLLFGYTIEHFRVKLFYKDGSYSAIFYFSLIYFGASIVRNGLFMPLKFIVWAIVLYYLLMVFGLLKRQYFKF